MNTTLMQIYDALKDDKERHFRRGVTETPEGEVSISVYYDMLLDTYKSEVERYTLNFPKKNLEELVEAAKNTKKAELVVQGTISHSFDTADDWCGTSGTTSYDGPAEVHLELDLSGEKPKLEYMWKKP